MNETWRPVVGYEGSYEVSDCGRVRSLDRISHGARAGRVLTPHIGANNGYLYVTLYRTPERRRAYVHTLVLESFVGQRPEGMEACHNDGDRTNPRLDNLRWGTHSDNINDVVTHRRHFQAQKTECARGHEFTLENTRIGTRGERICRSCARARSAAYKSKRKTRKP